MDLSERLSSPDKMAMFVAVVLPIAYAPGVAGATVVPRLAVGLLALPFAIVVIAHLLRRRDVPTVVFTAFLSVAALSALTNPSPLVSLKGTVLGGLTWLLLMIGFGTWALGRGLTELGRQLAAVAAILAVSVNILVGVAQITLNANGGELGSSPGRASGLMANAAFYGCSVIGVCGYAIVQAARHGTAGWYAAAGWTAFGSGISGSRGVAGLVVVLAVGVLVVTRLQAWRAATAGLVGLFLAARLTAARGGEAAASVVERTTSRGSSGRFDIWRYDLAAMSDRPVLGWGFANHGSAVRPHFTEAFTRSSAWDDFSMSWRDPHNIVLMLLISTGVVGLLLAGYFVVTHLRRESEIAFLVAFLVTAASWLLQPTTVHSLPIAMLFLGASVERLARPPEPTRERVALLVAGGVAIAMLVLVPNVVELRALRAGDAEGAETALAWIPGDAVLANEVAWAYTRQALVDPSYLERAVERSTLPLERDGDRPYYWAQHARRMLELGELDRVPAALDRAFELERWNPSAWEAKLAYAVAVQDYDLADETRVVICRLDLVMCATGSRFPFDPDSTD